MSRFTTSTSTGGIGDTKSMTLLTGSACDDDLFRKCKFAVIDAVTLLKAADVVLARPSPSSDVIRYANRYFLTGKKLSTDDLTQIRKVLGMILTGLKADVTIKVGDIGKGTLGSVAGVAGKTPTKPYHNTVLAARSGKIETKGAIHMSDKHMSDGRLAVVTLIHEAGHKFAGLRDYSYFDDNSVDPLSDFTDKSSAMKNADSYAWFTLKIGRKGKKGDFINKMHH